MPHKVIDFAIVGQPKAGTTAMAQFLSKHPQVCISSPKEPNFFATDFMKESDDFHGKRKYFNIRTRKDYDKCFSHCKAEQILGEATPKYAHSKSAAKNIYKHNPSAKIIIILRNPVDFMHSLHMQYVNSGIENIKDFKEAIKLDPERKKGLNIPSQVKYPSCYPYTERGKYYDQVKRFLDTFPQNNVLVLTHEEYKANNAITLKKVLDFLGVDPSFSVDFKTVHGSKAPRFETLNKIINKSWITNLAHKILPHRAYVQISKIFNKFALKEQQRTVMDIELKKELEQLFYDDVQKTSELLDRNLIDEWNFNK